MLTSRKIPAFSKKVADLPDTPSSTMTAAQIKAQMDASPEELRVAHNGAMDDLSSTTPGSSGAEQIGSAPILGVAGSTPYAQIADVKAQLNAATTGGIPDGSVTPAKLSFDPATQAELDAHTGATTGIHGATSAATANTLAFRDASGRLQVATPAVATDVATKGYVDGSFARIQRGTYTGDGTLDRTIAVGFTPKFVFTIAPSQTSNTTTQAMSTGGSKDGNVGVAGSQCVANGFRVGATNAAYGNSSGVAYEWVAFG